MSPRCLLVTGAAGFIGSAFVRAALRAWPEAQVISLDALTYAGCEDNLRGLDPARHRFVRGDVCDRAACAALIAERGVDAVVHFAAETHVDRSIRSPEPFLRTNLGGTAALLDAAREQRAPPRFHYVSTDEVYGDLPPGAPPSLEGDPLAPGNPYSATKAGGEHLALAYGRTYGLQVTAHRGANTYGPRQLPEKLIPVVIERALAGEPLPVYGDGRQVRDWLHVEDHCRAVIAILEGAAPGTVWNVGGGLQVENLELVQRLCALLDARRPERAPHSALIRHVTDRPGHDRRYEINSGALTAATGWRPRVALDEGLARTVGWYLESRGWAEAVRARPQYRAWMAEQYGGQ
jgi:dTDP-glucose 4,6-dehydratase